MSIENINSVEAFFRKPIEEVAQNIATSYVWHEDRKRVLSGQGAIFALQTESGTRRFFRLEEAVLYSHDYTMGRWSKSRGPEIVGLEPGEIIAYQFYQYLLPFIKVGGFDSAANIQPSNFKEIDKFGEYIDGEETEIGSAKLSRLVGLRQRELAHLTQFDFRGQRAFLLATGARQLSPEELKQLEDEILNFTS